MKKILKINVINILLLTYLEVMFGLLLFDSFNKETIISLSIYILLFSGLITILTSLFKDKVGKIINYIIYFVLCFIFSLQFVFKSSMKTFFSLSLVGIGDQVLDFFGELLYMVFSNFIGITLLFVPLILLIIYRKKINFNIYGYKRWLFIYVLVIPILFISYFGYIKHKDNENISILDLYTNVNNMSLNVQRLGVIPSTFLDVYRTIFGFEEKIVKIEYKKPAETIFKYEDNLLELNLDEKTPSIIKEYIENNPGTKKNEYTGIFKNKNLIFIVAEAFSTIGIDEKLTPTLYKLTNSGFIFNNYYVPYYLSTIGGEFSALTGIFPDSSTLSIWRNGSNSFPFGLANTFQKNGYNTYAYHNYSGYFQDRNKYLKTQGFNNFKACDMGLDINCSLWPPSDIELIERSYEDYINSDKPFITYYMTVSGHLEYNFFGNDMAEKNKKIVDGLDISYSAKAYKATQIELDRALEKLIGKLEENGVLDDTVIVMTADHYPYGLKLNEINELSDYKRDELFEINHNSLVIWNNKLNTTYIDKVGMPIDIIPTVYNLFDIDYDSRLFAGNDLLSNSDGLVILGNNSWITNKGKYNSVTNSYIGEEDNTYVNYINNIISNKIAFSKSIMLYDGYKYIKIND